MAKRKNSLPSGNFRVLALDYTDPDGKRHYKSFTAPTKKEARMLADEWKLSKKRKPRRKYIRSWSLSSDTRT